MTGRRMVERYVDVESVTRLRDWCETREAMRQAVLRSARGNGAGDASQGEREASRGLSEDGAA